MKKIVLFLILIVIPVLLIAGCDLINHPSSPATTFQKAGYLQLGATGSLMQISTSGVEVLDVVLFAFSCII